MAALTDENMVNFEINTYQGILRKFGDSYSMVVPAYLVKANNWKVKDKFKVYLKLDGGEE